MDYLDFLKRVIDDGIIAASQSYSAPKDVHKFEGAKAGFEACRDKQPAELQELIAESRRRQNEAYFESAGRPKSDPLYEQKLQEYWKLTCFAAEVEWVCNCVSAVLVNEGREPITMVTARGMLQAAKALQPA